MARKTERLEPDAILDAAATLLEDEGKLTMRALAGRLHVDPMAVYHYFPNKQAIHDALTGRLARQLAAAAPGMAHADNWRQRLAVLAGAYRTVAAKAPEFTRTVAQGGAPAQALAGQFARLFEVATEGLGLTDRQRRSAVGLLVDFIHGYTMSPVHDEQVWEDELGLLMLGIEAAAGGQA